MIANRVGIAQVVAVVLAHDQTTGGSLFVCHRDATEIRRPAGAIARVKCVENLAREVINTETIEPAGIGFAEQLQAGALIGRQVRVKRDCFGREVVAAVGAHLVCIDECDGIPLLDSIDATARFGLRQDEPVAIHVEQVMVGASARPGFVVLRGQPIDVRQQSLSHFEVMNEAITAVRVLHRVNDYDRVIENVVNAIITARGKQVIGRQHGGIGR